LPSRLFLKLLMSLLASFAVLIAIIFFIINFSFQQGFINYLKQNERQLVAGMRPFLISYYLAENNWQGLMQNRRLWSEALRSANIFLPPREQGPPRRGPVENGPVTADGILRPPREQGPLRREPIETGPITADGILRPPREQGPLRRGPVENAPATADGISRPPREQGPFRRGPVEHAPATADGISRPPREQGPLRREPIETAPITADGISRPPREQGPFRRGPVENAPATADGISRPPREQGPLRREPVENAPATTDGILRPPREQGPLRRGPVENAPATADGISRLPREQGPPRRGSVKNNVATVDSITRPPPTFAMRISLYDAQNNLIFGPDTTGSDTEQIEVVSAGTLIAILHVRSLTLEDDQLANSFVEQQQQNFVYIALTALLLALFLATVGAGVLLRPVNRVIKGVKRLAQGEYQTRVKVVGSDELAKLAQQFNAMANTLEQNEMLRAQWLADISHELRTPLTVIRGEIEALLDGVREPTPLRIQSLFDETNALAALIDDLHLLSIADNDALKLVLKPVALAGIIERQLEKIALRMEKKELSLSYSNQLVGSDLLHLDELRISQVISNLFENSLRYTDAQGQVQIDLTSAVNGQVKMDIYDTKPGVQDAELEKIFNRLYCADQSRSKRSGGSGLGLAICKSIVNAHGGSLVASHSTIGGVCITMTLGGKYPLNEGSHGK